MPQAAIRGRITAVPVQHELRVDVRPRWVFRLRGGTPDGLFRRGGDGVRRLIHVGDVPVLVGAVQASGERVIVGARSASEAACEEGVRRMRFALGLDDDLRPFHEAFRDDPHIGRVVRALPHLRVRRRPNAWEAFMWAVCEQLIAYEDAVEIQRRIVRALGRSCPATGLWDAPPPGVVAAQAPARLQSFGLTQARAVALRRAAIEVARGRVDLEHPDHEAGWRRLMAIPCIGEWTVEMTALMGQGRHDQIPAGDLGFVKLVGRLTTGHPKARAEISQVREFFARYGEWKGLAGEYLRAAGASTPSGAARVPVPAGTRW